jgi:flagellar hook-length control protein FliK
MTTLESTPTKTNPQANSLLKPEILTQGDKNIPNAIAPEIRTSLMLLDTLEAKTTQFDQNLPLQTKESSTVSDHEEAVHSPIFELDAPILKEKIINSGVFMESKIATLEGATQEIVDEQMSNDLKSQLLELHEELQTSPSHENRQLQFKVDELLTHIDYHQLLSHLNNSNSLYFPFAWEGLEKGSIELKKSKGEKFYCEINLTLKEHGNVDLFMGLHDENQLEIKIHTQKTQFKELLQTHIDELRTLLRDANLTLRSVRIFDENERLTQSLKAYESINDDTSDGFEVTI